MACLDLLANVYFSWIFSLRHRISPLSHATRPPTIGLRLCGDHGPQSYVPTWDLVWDLVKGLVKGLTTHVGDERD
jgi:hypothetical protein